LVGKYVIVPLVERRIPIIADKYVDVEFGTGALKITPAHDPNDYEIGLTHNLEVIDVLNPDGTISEAGQFLAHVNVVKQTTSTVFASIDSGLNHFIRPMFYDSYHHIENVSNPEGKKRFYTVVGYICETDTFGTNRQICEIKEGDILSFKNAGAYCFSMASNYNSRYRPAEVLVYKEKDYLIRERETIEDILNKQIETTIDF
jgi:hypothetical protein